MTDAHIATLVDVARSAGADVPDSRKLALSELVEAGYVSLADGLPVPRYKLTRSGHAVLDERGVGANES